MSARCGTFSTAPTSMPRPEECLISVCWVAGMTLSLDIRPMCSVGKESLRVGCPGSYRTLASEPSTEQGGRARSKSKDETNDHRRVQPDDHVQTNDPPCGACAVWWPMHDAHTTPLAPRRPCRSSGCGRKGNPRRVVTHTTREGVEYGGPRVRLKGRIIRWYSLWHDCG